MKQPLLTAFNLMLMANTALAQTPVTPYVGSGPVTATNPLPTTGTFSATINCVSTSPCIVDTSTSATIYQAITGPISACSTTPCITVIGVTPQSVLYGGADTKLIGDPCQVLANSYTPISIASSTPVNIVSGVSSEKTYICQIVLQNNAAESVLVVEATTGSTCGTISAGVFGSSVAGFNFAATGGISIGNGMHSVGRTATANDDLCIIQSTATQLTGGITWVRSS